MVPTLKFGKEGCLVFEFENSDCKNDGNGEMSAM